MAMSIAQPAGASELAAYPKLDVIAVGAHPDDVEILAAGTLCHLARQGHSMTVVTMTPGDCGSIAAGMKWSG